MIPCHLPVDTAVGHGHLHLVLSPEAVPDADRAFGSNGIETVDFRAFQIIHRIAADVGTESAAVCQKGNELPETPPQIGPNGEYREDPNASGGQTGNDHSDYPGNQPAQEEPPKPENTRFFLTTTLDNKVKLTDDALETILGVPWVFLPTVLKGCVARAKENNVELVTAEHMKIINDKRSKEKSRK